MMIGQNLGIGLLDAGFQVAIVYRGKRGPWVKFIRLPFPLSWATFTWKYRMIWRGSPVCEEFTGRYWRLVRAIVARSRTISS